MRATNEMRTPTATTNGNRCGAGALAISNANSGAANTANGKEVR